ncbi:MAG: FemAB family XrtA/PEP-CTERM system-associated protein, partial [Betaproteobacteria bacterium]
MSSIIEALQDRLGSPASGTAATVHMMQPEDMARWDAFVMRCPEATFFHRSGWKKVIEHGFGHKTWFMYAECDGKIQGVLPLAEINSLLFGHALCALPFCVYGGIAAMSEPAREALDMAAQNLASRLKVGHLEYRNIKPHHPDWSAKDLYVTFRKEIAAEAEQNLLAIPRKQRAMVRKGIKAGLESSIDCDTERFFSAYSTSVHRLGTPVF